MKKFLLALLSTASLQALPLGNPADPTLFNRGCIWSFPSPCDPIYPCGWGGDFFEMTSLRVGYVGDFVFDRHLKNNLPAGMMKSKINTQAGFIALNFADRLDLFTTLGASRLQLLAISDSLNQVLRFPPASRAITIESDTRFSWSLGARASLFECGPFGVGVEGQYFHTSTHVDSVSDQEVFLEYPDKVPMREREWQLGLGAYYLFLCEGSFVSAAVPYAGIKWSSAHVNMGNSLIINENGLSSISSLTLLNLCSQRRLGYALGVTLAFCNRFGLTVEARFRDERALFVNGEIRF